ncbi:MAG: hypothetical protein ACTSSE_08595 [Candidatus Thorarchaeota archaeon]
MTNTDYIMNQQNNVIDLILEKKSEVTNSKSIGRIIGVSTMRASLILQKIGELSGAIVYRRAKKYDVDLDKLRIYRENMGVE